MLQTRDPKRLNNKEGSSMAPWVSPGKGSRIDFVGELSGESKHRNRRNQVGEEETEGESTQRDYCTDSGGICKSSAMETSWNL